MSEKTLLTLLLADWSIRALNDAIAARVLMLDSFLSRTSAVSVDLISDSTSLHANNNHTAPQFHGSSFRGAYSFATRLLRGNYFRGIYALE